MASAILFPLFLTTLFCVVLSLPAHKMKSVQLDASNSDTEEINTEMVLNNNDNPRELNPVNSLDSVITFDAEVAPSLEDSVKRLRRMKRQVIRGGRKNCPDSMMWFARTCMTYERYHALLTDQEEEK